MDLTPNLRLPYLAAAQAQKHVTHNEALRALDAVVQIGVTSRLDAPPPAPENGSRYIVAADATGAWSGHDHAIAAYQDAAWLFYAPQVGWLAWIADEAKLAVWNGTSWIPASSASLNPADVIGVNATPDTTNRLSVASPASLFNHEGAGHQQKINKATAGDTASVLYQTNWSGRAEVGLTGDDDFHFKVSPDGSTWHEGIVIDKNSGIVSFPSGADVGGVLLSTFSDRPDPTSYDGVAMLKITDERNGAVLCYSDGTYWRRATDGRIAQSAVVDYYVDSVAGSDAGAGTSSGAAIQTLGQLATLIAALPAHRRSGLRIALKRGSLWHERFSADATMGGIRFEAYGSLAAPMPLIDCADALDNAEFTATDETDHVYEIAHTVETDALAAEVPGLWVDGQRLTWAVSVEACDARPGTFHVPNPTDQTSITIYVHPLGSTDPTSDGKNYEATTRKSGLDFFAAPYAEAEGIHARRNHVSYGSITLGRWNRARGCRTSDGNTHNLFMRSFCEVEDHIADGWYANGLSATTYIGFDTNGDAGDGDPGQDVWIRLKNCAARQTYQVRIAPAAITSITQATPCVVTAPAHGIAQWDFVVIDGVDGMTELNGRTFLVSAVTTDTITLQTANLDDSGRVNVNSAGYGAYSGGGVVRLATFMDNAASGSTVGFHFHTDGQLVFERIELEGCDTFGCAMPFNADNTRLFTLENVSARQFYIGVGVLADKTVFRGLQGNVSFLNRPPLIGATLLRTDRANQTIEMDGISATLNSSGNVYMTQQGATVRFRRGTLVGFNSLFRCTAAEQTLDVQEMTHDDNGKTGSGYQNFDINATAAASIKLTSDFNDFGGGSRSFVYDGNTWTLAEWRMASANDWNSSA